MFDVVIVGAGVCGGMIASRLSHTDLKICIVEKEADVAMGSSRANSAIVHAGFDAYPGTLKAKLNVRGSAMMPEIAKQLGVKYRNNGSLVIGFTEEDRATLKELLRRGKKNKVPGLELISGEEARAMEPALSDKVICALHAPTGAIICPYELTIAAVGNAMDNGAELKLNFEVFDIKDRKDHYELISCDGDVVEGRFIVNCAGIYSDTVATMAGDDTFSVTPRRGEYVLLDKECGSMVNHTIFRTPGKMGKGILITPTVDGNLLLGPTAKDIEDKDDNSTTAEGIAQIQHQALENVPGIPMNKVITSFCGLRAVGSKGDFILNVPEERFVNCAAIESPGLSASPAIAEYVEALLRCEKLKFSEREDAILTRRPAHWFRDLSEEEKNEVISRDSKYARIICRCEMISEGEILEALRVNPKAGDLDGVKRRTRSGMGRCQGGFCSPYVTELIAQECGIPYERVTKFGGDSFVNVGKTKGRDCDE